MVEIQYRTVTPYFCVPDADAELAFLKAAFDATEVECQRTEDNKIMHAELKIGDSLVMLGQSGGPRKAMPAAIYLWVPDADKTYAAAMKAGAASESAPENKPWGHRTAGVIGPNGLTWWIAAPLA